MGLGYGNTTTKSKQTGRKPTEKELEAARQLKLQEAEEWRTRNVGKSVDEVLCRETDPAHDVLGAHVHVRHNPLLVFMVDPKTGQWLR